MINKAVTECVHTDDTEGKPSENKNSDFSERVHRGEGIRTRAWKGEKHFDSYASKTRIFLSLLCYDLLDILCQTTNDSYIFYFMLL